jgi:hypothetical protein
MTIRYQARRALNVTMDRSGWRCASVAFGCLAVLAPVVSPHAQSMDMQGPHGMELIEQVRDVLLGPWQSRRVLPQ